MKSEPEGSVKFIPPPRFILAVAVKAANNITESGLQIIEDAPQARAKVIAIGAKAAETLPGLEVGDIVHVMPGNVNVLRLQPTLLHCILFDEAILGWQKAADVDAPLKPVLSIHPNKVEKVNYPAGVIDGRGLKLNG